jgi:heavy metal sensor kinase
LPIRWRLTIWYVALLASILVVFSATVFVGLRFFLERSLDDTLENQAALLTEAIDIDDGRPSIGDRRIRNRPGQQFVRLVDQDGELLTDSNPVLNEAGNDPGLDRALNGFQDIRWSEIQGERMRVLSQPVMVDDTVVAVVQVGLTSSSADSILRQTAILIVSTGSLVIVLAVIGGVWLAGRTLHPIDRMTRLAARISDQDLAQRIDPLASDDELGRLARTFNAMLDRLERSINRQRQFTAAASHELRTPLAMMQGQVELALARNRDPEADREVLEGIHVDVNRLTRISNTLLALARSDSGQIGLQIEPVQLDALIDLIGEQYLPIAEESGISLAVRAEPVAIDGDEDRLIQLLVNLVDNAMQHTAADGTVSVESTVDSKWTIITVSDNGSGIDAEHLPYIFDRFYRVTSKHSNGSNGAGLGLSISKMIVDAHRGEIHVNSEPGHGTRVTVRLPRIQFPNSRS